MRSILLSLLLFPVLLSAQEQARILDHSIKYIIHNDEKAEIEEYSKIRINDEKAEFFAMYRDYTDQFRKITSVTLDVFDKDGKRVKRLKKTDAIEVGFHPSYEINDSKVFILKPEYKNYPFTVEITSKIKLDGFTAFPEWVPRPYFNVAVDHSKFTVISPADFPFRFKEQLVIGKSKLEAGQMITEYEISNLPHVEKKIRYQDFYNEQPKVLVTPQKFRLDNSQGSTNSWQDFGNWFLLLNSERAKLTDQTKNYIDSLKKNSGDKLIENIYAYMQNKTRYVSIQLGIGGFKSLPTEEVEKTGYGDCKALTTYAKNMLNYAGIKSNYILVRAGNDVPDVIADFPSNQFNHVFLAVPRKQDTLYLECTSQTSPSNYLGTFTDDRNVLWIERDESSIIRSRIYSHLNNVQTNTFKIKLKDSGDAVIDLLMKNEGVLFDEIMLFKMAPSDYVKKHNQDKFNYSDFTLSNFEFSQADKNAPELNLKYTIQVNGLAKPAGTKHVFPIVPAIPFNKYISKDDFMKFYSIKRGISVVDEILVDLPNDQWIYNLPETSHVDSDFGNYHLSTSFDGKQLKIVRKMTFYKGEYAKQLYDSFKEFYQKIEKIESRKLVFNSKT
jgi:Domain of Unknown Function with PDB structure (DUF3857)